MLYDRPRQSDHPKQSERNRGDAPVLEQACCGWALFAALGKNFNKPALNGTLGTVSKRLIVAQ